VYYYHVYSTGADVQTLLQDIHLELLSLASAIQLNIEGHMYKAIAESLVKSDGIWSCPIGQVQEHGLCSKYITTTSTLQPPPQSDTL
jgi:hypothetical protein